MEAFADGLEEFLTAGQFVGGEGGSWRPSRRSCWAGVGRLEAERIPGRKNVAGGMFSQKG